MNIHYGTDTDLDKVVESLRHALHAIFIAPPLLSFWIRASVGLFTDDICKCIYMYLYIHIGTITLSFHHKKGMPMYFMLKTRENYIQLQKYTLLLQC